MTYTATLRGYTFGDEQEWDWLPGSARFESNGYRGMRIPIAGRHGEHAAGGDYASSSRLVFELEHGSENRVTVEQAGARLRAAFAPHTANGLLELTVDLPSGAVVVRGRPTPPQIVPDANHFGYGVARAVFEMCDPLLYAAGMSSVTVSVGGTGGGVTSPIVSPVVSTSSGTSGDAAVTNSGTAPAHWVASLTGGTTGVDTPRLILEGQLIQIDGTIPAGSVLTIDSRDRSVLLDGQPRAWAAFRSAWWLIPPGQSTFSYRAVSGDGSATLTWRDASF